MHHSVTSRGLVSSAAQIAPHPTPVTPRFRLRLLPRVVAGCAAAIGALAFAAPSLAAGERRLNHAWMVGLHLGELPWQGSFKPGLSVGHYVNELVFVGGLLQIGDSIRRDGTSFNVDNTGLKGLISSSEAVAPRAFLGVRLRPHRYAPFASLGAVYNGADVETMRFDARSRTIGQGSYEGAITIRQERAAALRPAVGLGYSYTFDFGLQLSAVWSGWVFEEPHAHLEIRGETPLTTADEETLKRHINEGFASTITNKYHIFHIGAGYVFEGG